MRIPVFVILAGACFAVMAATGFLGYKAPSEMMQHAAYTVASLSGVVGFVILMGAWATWGEQQPVQEDVSLSAKVRRLMPEAQRMDEDALGSDAYAALPDSTDYATTTRVTAFPHGKDAA